MCGLEREHMGIMFILQAVEKGSVPGIPYEPPALPEWALSAKPWIIPKHLCLCPPQIKLK